LHENSTLPTPKSGNDVYNNHCPASL